MTFKARRGMVLLWTIATIAILAAVAAAVAPYLLQFNDKDDVAVTSSILHTVSAAVDSFNVHIARTGPTINQTPITLSVLTTVMTQNTTAGCTIAGDQYTNASVTAWNTWGPFGSIVFPTTGVWTPMGRINNSPSRASTTVGTARTATTDPYFIQIQSVPVGMARLLDAYVDGTSGQTADTVQYTTPGSDSLVTLSYRVFFTSNSC